MFFQPLVYGMAAPYDIILTSSNYFSWKYRMEDVLWSMGLFRITSRKEIEPTDDDKKIKWENKYDEAHGLIGMSIFTDMWFQLSGIDEPEKYWETLEPVFGKHNEIRGHRLENELIYLNPSDFSCIQDYLSKNNSYTLMRRMQY